MIITMYAPVMHLTSVPTIKVKQCQPHISFTSTRGVDLTRTDRIDRAPRAMASNVARAAKAKMGLKELAGLVKLKVS